VAVMDHEGCQLPMASGPCSSPEGKGPAIPLDFHIGIEHGGDAGRRDAETPENPGDLGTAAVDPDPVGKVPVKVLEGVHAVESPTEERGAVQIATEAASSEHDTAGHVVEGEAGDLEVARLDFDLERLLLFRLQRCVDVDGARQDPAGFDDAVQDREIDGPGGGQGRPSFAADGPLAAQGDAVGVDRPRGDVDTVVDRQSRRNLETDRVESRDLEVGAIDSHETGWRAVF